MIAYEYIWQLNIQTNNEKAHILIAAREKAESFDLQGSGVGQRAICRSASNLGDEQVAPDFESERINASHLSVMLASGLHAEHGQYALWHLLTAQPSS